MTDGANGWQAFFNPTMAFPNLCFQMMPNQPPVSIPPAAPLRLPPAGKSNPPPPVPLGQPLIPGMPYNFRDKALPTMTCFANDSQSYTFCTTGDGTKPMEQFNPYNPSSLTDMTPIPDGGQVR